MITPIRTNGIKNRFIICKKNHVKFLQKVGNSLKIN